MARQNRRKPEPDKPLSTGFGNQQRVSDPDGDWIVRPVTGASANKSYLCPGCNQRIPEGLAHTLVWPDDWNGSIDDRRHWHTACWTSRRKLRRK